MPTLQESVIKSRVARHAMRDERDLGFAPVQNGLPKTLSRAQIKHFNREGYVLPFRVFGELEANANRAYFDALLDKMRAFNDGRDTYAINGYHICCQGIYDIATHPRILDLVEDLIGPDIIAWGSHFFCKMPGDPKSVPWHQDASYWPLTPARVVTVWLAIDDTDRDNAAMKFLPRTHNIGHLPWKTTGAGAVLDQEIRGVELLEGKFGPAVYDELKAGELSLHADMLAHGSDPNTSARCRCGLTIRYCPPTVCALDASWAQQSIVCRGEDCSRHWANVPRPQGDNLSRERKPVPIAGN